MPQAPWSEVPAPGALLPDGLYHLKINEMIEERSAGTAEGSVAGKLMYTIVSAVVEPVDHKDELHFERYTIGSNDDLDALDPVTWRRSFGAKLLKKCLEDADVPLDADMDVVCAAAVGHEYLAVVEVEKREGFADQSRVRRTYRVGEREPGASPVAGATATTGARPALPKPTVVAPPSAASAPRPVGRPPGRPAAASRVAPPPPPPQTVQPSRPEKLLPCGVCGQSVARSQYAAHVEACNG